MLRRTIRSTAKTEKETRSRGTFELCERQIMTCTEEVRATRRTIRAVKIHTLIALIYLSR